MCVCVCVSWVVECVGWRCQGYSGVALEISTVSGYDAPARALELAPAALLQSTGFLAFLVCVGFVCISDDGGVDAGGNGL